LVIAVADGAGSASHAEIGATLACDEFVKRIEELRPDQSFNRDGMIALFSEVRSIVLTEADRLSVRHRELACTALLAVIGPDFGAFAQVGDGAIVYGQGEDHRVVFWPQPGEYANTTDFLTDIAFKETIRFDTVVDPIVDVAVLTDGLQRLALDFTSSTPFPGFFRPLFDELRAAADPEFLLEPFRKFLDSDRVNNRTDDDKTLVLAVRQP
jgi:hypothetical protein